MCIVAIDFDGTINSDFAAAKLAIETLKNNGHYIVIWSSRNNARQHPEKSDALVQEMIEQLNRHSVPYDEVDFGKNGKFHAQVYIDDKAIKFENNWNEIISKIY